MNINNKSSTYYKYFIYVFCICICSCKSKPNEQVEKTKGPILDNQIGHMDQSPTIDGVAEIAWNQFEWHPIDQTWIGSNLSPNDFEGKYKFAWREDGIYILALITDDVLIDTHQNPLDKYWDDDCLEVFIDHDASGGNHQYNHQAFAYHISLKQKILDIGRDSLPHFYNSNVDSAMKRLSNNQYMWEVKVKIFDQTYQEMGNNKSIPLKVDQRVGFAIAYCDNDSSPEREHFIGSVVVHGADKNRGWIDAGIFGKYTLVK